MPKHMRSGTLNGMGTFMQALSAILDVLVAHAPEQFSGRILWLTEGTGYVKQRTVGLRTNYKSNK